MKNASMSMAIMDQKAVEYLLNMRPSQVKKTLYVMTLLKAEQKLNDSPYGEVKDIAAIYDGYLFTAKAAKDLANKLAKLYAQKNPHVFMSKKELESYTNVWYRRLNEAVGPLGFEYVLDTIRRGKAMVNQPGSRISEKDMLRALIWVEQREGVNKESSERHHRKKGLELLGFNGLEEVLLDTSFIIANVYPLVMPKYEADEKLSKVKEEKQEEPVKETVRKMKVHFIEKAELLQAFYDMAKPEVPIGYSEKELKEESVIYVLAVKGLLKDSAEVLAYIEAVKAYDACYKAICEEFSLQELDVLVDNPEKIKNLIANEW